MCLPCCVSARQVISACTVMLTSLIYAVKCAGLTQETVTEDYRGILQQKDINLCVLNIKDRQQEKLMDRIKSMFSTITSNKFKVIDIVDIDRLPRLVSELMVQAFDQILQKAAAHQDHSSGGQADHVPKLSFSSSEAPSSSGSTSSIPILIPCSHLDKASSVISKLQVGLDKAYLVSKPGAQIPYLTSSKATSDDDSTWLVVSPEGMSGAISDLNASHAKLLSSPQELGRAAEAWQAAASRLTGQIEDFAEVLGDVVFPVNCHTRRCGDLSGASLHLPGLIKALCTDFAYKKIFSAKKAGGRREYSVALVVDVSTSMQGHLADAAIETLVCMISALVQIGIENFAIVSFGQQVRLLKACSMSWDAAAMHLLLSKLTFDVDCATFDANAIVLTTRLLENFGAKGPRTMFVISDGYGISGSRFAQVRRCSTASHHPVLERCSLWTTIFP